MRYSYHGDFMIPSVNVIMIISIYENMTTIFHSQLPRGAEHVTWLFLLCWVNYYFDMVSCRIFFCHIIISYGHMARPYSWTRGYVSVIWSNLNNFYSEVRQQKHKIYERLVKTKFDHKYFHPLLKHWLIDCYYDATPNINYEIDIISI